MLAAIVFLAGAVGPGYLIMRRHGGVSWGILSYIAGLLLAFALGVGSMFIEEEVFHIPPGQSGRPFGIALWCGLLAPGLGIWWGN